MPCTGLPTSEDTARGTLEKRLRSADQIRLMILLLLLMTGVLGAIIGPFIALTIQIVALVFGLETY